MNEIQYSQIHCHSRFSVNRLSGEGAFHKPLWPIERLVMKHIMLTPEQIKRLAKRKGLKYVAITDHNTIPSFMDDDTLIRGEEWGQRKGHSNFIGMKRPIDPDAGFYEGIEPDVPQDFYSAAKLAREQGAFITINHPFKSDEWLWGKESYELADAIEIWNGNWGPENEKALEMWQKLLIQGFRIWATAGNDFHVKFLFNIDSQVIATRGAQTKEMLLDNLKTGNFSISKNVGSPVIFINRNLQYSIENYVPDLELRVISGNNTLKIKNCGKDGEVDNVNIEGFIRLELWSGNEPLSFSNPIFV